ncbi:hypothetical protein FJQ54_10920 [Sandaracinobacter neustonicus]|uniref:HdeA/HdeB family protein n=1 Tax=Sandaracinobacter neustonicus TaxID=1715348 RepID=A0A501XIL7_9SPHN|nr:hypothetical protein [Sandaracinobacter neustonicus]TPE60508.1 hypothetical protein FJQ54_10920 [Sandaracinobacter neustonicus]
MTRKFLLALAGLSALQSPVLAAEDNLLDVTCGQYLTALSVAAPKAGASKAEQQLAAQAQDDIAQGLMWIHGYLSGRDAAAGKPAPMLTRSWLTAQITPLAKACRERSPDGSMQLLDIVKAGL